MDGKSNDEKKDDISKPPAVNKSPAEESKGDEKGPLINYTKASLFAKPQVDSSKSSQDPLGRPERDYNMNADALDSYHRSHTTNSDFNYSVFSRGSAEYIRQENKVVVHDGAYDISLQYGGGAAVQSLWLYVNWLNGAGAFRVPV